MIDPVFRHLRSVGVRVDVGARYLIARCDHAVLAAAMRESGAMCDALIVDAPYSERTHSGHDGGAAQSNADERIRGNRARQAAGPPPMRRHLDYSSWGADDVSRFVADWHPLTRGWIGSLTDDVLAPDWRAAMEAAGRYAFSPLACVESGSRVRLVGDGPSQWATWLVVARPRSAEWARWGTLPGAYVGGKEAKDVTGGKPLWLMRAIVGDYSAPGDLVADPCMGAGTTLVAAIELGRRAIGCEPDAGRYAMALARVSAAREQTHMRLDVEATRGEQTTMDLGGER